MVLLAPTRPGRRRGRGGGRRLWPPLLRHLPLRPGLRPGRHVGIGSNIQFVGPANGRIEAVAVGEGVQVKDYGTAWVPKPWPI